MEYEIRKEAESAARLIEDAGGEVIGRTRLQKIAYVLEAVGLGDGFGFKYKHYGPYSEELTSAIKFAAIFDLAVEEERIAAWGGGYSIFRSLGKVARSDDVSRLAIIKVGNGADPVNLELTATAILLAKDGDNDPWAETKIRKPDKATADRIRASKELLDKLKLLVDQGKLPSNV